MQAVTPPLLTIDDFEKLPDELAHFHELEDGKLVDVSGNTPKHNALRDLLTAMLLFHVTEHKLGKVLSEQEFQFGANAYGPDVSFFGPKKATLLKDELRVQRFVPDLAIEIVSRNDKFEKLIEKANRYRRCGTIEVWIFSIKAREAFVFSVDRSLILDDDCSFQSPLIPRFSIKLKDLFDQI